MGAWGHKLYDSDAGLSLRDEFKDWSRLPLDGAALLEFARAHHPEADAPDDEDHSVFWLVMADQCHRYGIDCPALFERDTRIIDDGVDTGIMRELDTAESDLRRRSAALRALKDRWSAGNPRPVRRRILARPQAQAVAPGDVWIYPTEDGNPPNTYFSQAEIERDFRPDGWNAFAIGATGHQLGYFALAFFMRLHIDSTSRPDLASCRSAAISGVRYFIMQDHQPLAHAVGWAVVTRSVLKKMRAEKLGRLALSWSEIRARLNGTDEIESSLRNRISGLLDVYQRAPGSRDYMDYARPLDVRLCDLLETSQG